jgi:hypothetical protein
MKSEDARPLRDNDPRSQPAAQTQEQDLLKGPVAGRTQSIRNETAAFLGVPIEKVFDVLRGVWTTSKGQPPLTDQELMVGMAIVSRYGLDPFAREIYVTRDKKGRLMTIIGIDGFIRILDRTEHYDGFEQDIVMGENGSIAEVTTRIHSKTRKHPAVYRAFMTDYMKLGGFMAGQIPGHMLRIFSIKHAARLFVPMGTVVTHEEARMMGYQEPAATEDQTQSHVDQARKMREAHGEIVAVDCTAPPTSAQKAAMALLSDPPLNPPTAEEVLDACDVCGLDRTTCGHSPPHNPPTVEEVAEHEHQLPSEILCTPAQRAVADAVIADTTPEQTEQQAAAWAELTQRIDAADSTDKIDFIEDDAAGCVTRGLIFPAGAVELSRRIAEARERIENG